MFSSGIIAGSERSGAAKMQPSRSAACSHSDRPKSRQPWSVDFVTAAALRELTVAMLVFLAGAVAAFVTVTEAGENSGRGDVPDYRIGLN